MVDFHTHILPEIDDGAKTYEQAIQIINQAKEEGMNENNVYYIENKNDIIDLIKKISQKGDIILFKASNGMKFYEIAEETKKLKEAYN